MKMWQYSRLYGKMGEKVDDFVNQGQLLYIEWISDQRGKAY